MGKALNTWLKLKKELPLDEEAILNIHVAAHFIQSKTEKLCAKFGITAGQYNVLRILKGIYPQGHPRCEIITRMIDSSPDITRLIDRLEKQGFVERIRSKEDRRLSLTRITSKGLKVLEKMQPQIDKIQKLFTSNLTNEECMKLSFLTEKIYAHLL
ncbi:MAG: MarR family transcriptional regulator [Ignavibacteria bacterium]|jgi:DNA-binding MarR family transcriptional regulator